MKNPTKQNSQNLQGYKYPVGVQPKIRAMTNAEQNRMNDSRKYQKNGKTTLLGAARMVKDMATTSLKRVFGIDSYKKGGTVKKTGLALVHKGEVVMPKKKFVKEHKHLVKVLKSGKKHKMKKEAHKQERELKEYV